MKKLLGGADLPPPMHNRVKTQFGSVPLYRYVCMKIYLENVKGIYLLIFNDNQLKKINKHGMSNEHNEDEKRYHWNNENV